MTPEQVGVVRELVRDAVGTQDGDALLDVMFKLELVCEENKGIVEFPMSIAGKALTVELESARGPIAWTVFQGDFTLPDAWMISTVAFIRLLKSIA